MKRITAKSLLIALTIVAFVGVSGASYGQDKKFPKEKGPALKQLESAAGKKIEDVKVPEVPKPTPVQPSKTK